jgi:hypothetical protein
MRQLLYAVRRPFFSARNARILFSKVTGGADWEM